MYKGVIIEESLKDPSILSNIKIENTKVESVIDEHETPWLKQWTLHTVVINDEKAEKVAQQLSYNLDYSHGTSWYADFKNDTTHYIIFKDKVFKIDRSRAEEYKVATDYGISLGIPAYQVDFAPDVVVWER